VQYGFEAIAFFEGEWNQNMHSPEDTIENMNVSYLVNTTKIITAVLAYVADLDTFDYPQVYIESPKRGRAYYNGRQTRIRPSHKTIIRDEIWIWADVTPGDAPIEKVEFYYRDKLVYTDTDYPYKWELNRRSFRRQRIDVIAYDTKGRITSDWLEFFYLNPRTRR
jgi:hypothetical protein